MIQWRPGNYSYWEAENIGSIRSTGLESSIRLIWTISNMKITTNGTYVLTLASGADKSTGSKQLAYIPENRVNGIVRLDLKHFYARSVTNFSGKRYLTPDNSQYLPCYCVNDLDMGAKLRLKNTFCDAGVGISNIFNASYQSIAWYPMPGRAFMLSVVFQLKNNK
jgi:outer membrane receptor for ferrienterochelin and colicin